MAEKLRNRFILDVVYRDREWRIQARGYRRLNPCGICKIHSQADAVDMAVDFAVDLQMNVGLPCQVVIHGKDGRIKSERGYPDETPKRKG